MIPWEQAGQTHYFIIDTGAPRCALDDHVFPNLRERRVENVRSPSGPAKEIRCDPPDIVIGPIHFASLKEVIKLDCTTLSRASGRPIAGIIGMDALRDFVLQFDFDAGRFRLLRSDAASHDDWGMKVPLATTSNQWSVRATVDGQPADFILDSGNDSDGMLPGWWIEQIAKTSKTVNQEAVTFTGSSYYRLVRATDCEFAGNHHPNLLLSESKMLRPYFGITFIGQYVATLDFPNNLLYLKKGKRFGIADKYNMSGLHLEWTAGTTKVRTVDDATPAAIAGVKAGDVILQVNELKANECDLDDLRDELCSGDGNPIRLRLRRDTTMHDFEFRLKKAV